MQGTTQGPTNWTAILFLLGFAITFWWEAMTQKGKLRAGAMIICVAFLLSAIFWRPIEAGWPVVGAFVSNLAQNPQSWFTLAVFAAAIVFLSRPLRFRWKGDQEDHDASSKIDATWINFPSLTNEIQAKYKQVEALARTNLAQLDTIEDALGVMQRTLEEFGADLNRARDKTDKIEQAVFSGGTLLTGPTDSRIEALETLMQDLKEKLALTEGDTKKLVRLYPDTNADLLGLLSFAVDQVTVALLDKLISEMPTEPIPLEGDKDHIEDRYEQAAAYVRTLSAQFGAHIRGVTIRNIIESSEREADGLVRRIAAEEKISGDKVIDLRRYKIVELQCLKIRQFLQYERNDVAELALSKRDRLIEQLDRRNR